MTQLEFERELAHTTGETLCTIRNRGFSLMVMQESYQLSRLVEEQERFLEVTGISRELYQSLSSAHRSSQKGS